MSPTLTVRVAKLEHHAEMFGSRLQKIEESGEGREARLNSIERNSLDHAKTITAITNQVGQVAATVDRLEAAELQRQVREEHNKATVDDLKKSVDALRTDINGRFKALTDRMWIVIMPLIGLLLASIGNFIISGGLFK
jgi:chromosome segregation ATPase